MFYDKQNNKIVSKKDLLKYNLPIGNLPLLATYGYYALTFNKPEYDSSFQGIEPDGDPYLSSTPYTYIQNFKIYNLLDRFKPNLKQDITNQRRSHEYQGIYYNDILILTTKEDQSRLSIALQGMISNNLETIDFKAGNGWVKLTQEDLTNILKLVTNHTQACFTNERRLSELIDSATTLEELNKVNLSEGWPILEIEQKKNTGQESI